MKSWILYVFLLSFATYWACNLILWYPWSYSSTLGIALMLSVTPLLWVFTSYRSLVTSPDTNRWRNIAIVSSIFLFVSIVSDYIFFGLIRGAMEALYHPTTFYGYGFLIFLPITLGLFLRKIPAQIQFGVRNLLSSGLIGFSCMAIITLIIFFDIKF